MTAQEKRQAVIAKYDMLIGRNYYSQNLRDYCFKNIRMATTTVIAVVLFVMHTRRPDRASAYLIPPEYISRAN